MKYYLVTGGLSSVPEPSNNWGYSIEYIVQNNLRWFLPPNVFGIFNVLSLPLGIIFVLQCAGVVHLIQNRPDEILYKMIVKSHLSC